MEPNEDADDPPNPHEQLKTPMTGDPVKEPMTGGGDQLPGPDRTAPPSKDADDDDKC